MASSMVKIGSAAAITAVILAGAWTATGIMTMREVKKALENISDQPLNLLPVRLTNLDHREGFLSAHGSMEIRLAADALPLAIPAKPILLGKIQYDVNTMPTPSAPCQFHWSYHPNEKLLDSVGAAADSFHIDGNGHTGWNGDIVSTFGNKPYTLSLGDSRMTIGTLDGHIFLHNSRFQIEEHLDKIEANDSHEQIVLNSLTFSAALDDIYNDTGSIQLAIDKMASSEGEIQGFSIQGGAINHDDRRDQTFKIGIAHLKSNDVTLDIMPRWNFSPKISTGRICKRSSAL